MKFLAKEVTVTEPNTFEADLEDEKDEMEQELDRVSSKSIPETVES